MGPWTHGAWAGSNWNKFGTYDFATNINEYFRDSLETKFFNYYLKDKGNFDASEATVFETGTNEWKHFNKWPPQNSKDVVYYFESNKNLSPEKKLNQNGFEEYVSDPGKPVPYTNGIYRERNNEYMVEDQRFASMREDVLVYETSSFKERYYAYRKNNCRSFCKHYFF